MNYVTTNIRLYEDDYRRLKAEAYDKGRSLSAIIREKIGQSKSKLQTNLLLQNRNWVAKKINKKLKDFDIVVSLREMRSSYKW